jgi:DNA-binding transcriptional LysR family regulator
MDRIEAMSVFIAVVDAGSLSGAARKLRMPLPTVSRKLSDLEAHVTARLLNRSTRQLSLTDAGNAYAAACRRILEDVGEAERAAAGEYSEPRGDLMISAPLVFGRMHLLPIVNEFLKAYPQVDVRLVLGDRINNLLQEHLDLALRIGELTDEGLIATRVGLTRRVVCASPAYLAERGTPAHPQDLEAHQCVVFDGLGSADEWVFKSGRGNIAVQLQPRLIVNTADAAIDAAAAGVGLTRVLCYQIAAALKAGKVVKVLEQFEPDPAPVSLLYARQPRLAQKLRAFLDFAAPRLRARTLDAPDGAAAPGVQ